MNNVIIDTEASGPCIEMGDLIEFAAIKENGDEFLSAKFPPLFNEYSEGAYKALGITREEHLSYTGDFKEEAYRFKDWLGGRHTMWTDNPAFDWQWINWLMHSFTGDNPLGFSARRIGDFYAGLNRDIRASTKWKKLRRTKHDHNPLNDVRGNMEAFKEIRKRYKV